VNLVGILRIITVVVYGGISGSPSERVDTTDSFVASGSIAYPFNGGQLDDLLRQLRLGERKFKKLFRYSMIGSADDIII